MITKVYLLSVPLERDYKHTLYFADATAQQNYFNGKIKHSFTDFTYQRKDGVIRIPLDYDVAVKCNYIMYQNTAESNKWYYAFITGYEYKGDDVTDLTVETDVMQTYMFDYRVLMSFVEREHTDDDTIGKNTYPENLELGEYVCEYRDMVTDLVDCSYIIGATEKPIDLSDRPEFIEATGNTYNGIYSGIWYAPFNKDEISTMNLIIERYAEAGKSDAIKCLFMYPTNLLAKNGIAVAPSEKPKEITKTVYPIPYSTYKPKNNKLYVYPYQYLLVTNNNGGSAIYQFEHFTDDVSFFIKGCLTPGGSIRLIPKNYKELTKNDEEGLNLGKYPICNWTSDVYTNWLTQNSVNIGLNIASGVGQVIAGAATAVGSGGIGAAVGGGMIVGGVSAITGQLAQIHQMSFTPPQSNGNVNCGDVITADGTNTFYFMQMRIRDEYLSIIDNYFSMFGYKCNRLKVPNKAHRSFWWYTKTIDVNISGDAVPQMDLEKIKGCYNNGITFWRSDPKNYNRTNDVS